MVNHDAIDRWSAVHFISGLAFGLLGLRPTLALGGAVAYEIGEYAHEWPSGSVLFGSKQPESAANLAADLALYTGAYFGGRQFREVEDAPAMGAAALAGAVLLTMAFSKQASIDNEAAPVPLPLPPPAGASGLFGYEEPYGGEAYFGG